MFFRTVIQTEHNIYFGLVESLPEAALREKVKRGENHDNIKSIMTLL